MYAKDKAWLKKITERFASGCTRFEDIFKTGARSNQGKARHYLNGLVQAPNGKRNLERMEESVSEFDYDSAQHFISNSPWNHQAVYDRVASITNDYFKKKKDTCLLIDESGFEKKGKSSAGVARQYNGRQGKVDNCQVGVFAALSSGKEVVPVGAKLYLPDSWTDDPERCDKAKIPEDERDYKTKPELALEMIDHLSGNEVKFGWVGGDALYGNNHTLRRSLDDRGITFVMDVSNDQHAYCKDPNPYMPEPTPGQGRPRKFFISDEKSASIAKLVESLPENQWEKIKVRKATKGTLKVLATKMPLYFWDKECDKARKWVVIVTKNLDGTEVKYSVSNCLELPLVRLAFMQRQRYWIEHSFEIAKSTCGLADYQIRSWVGWHHHIAMVFMVMLFIMEEKRAAPSTCHLLSPTDIREMLIQFLPQRKKDPDEIFRQMEKRHIKRLKAQISQAKAKLKWEKELE